ncbi:hypothetical protein ES703_124523 [subsurface metagenome]
MPHSHAVWINRIKLIPPQSPACHCINACLPIQRINQSVSPVNDNPGIIVFYQPYMRMTTLRIGHMLTATHRSFCSSAPFFPALVRHPLAVLSDPARRIPAAPPKHHLDRMLIEPHDYVGMLARPPQGVPLVVIFQLSIVSPEAPRLRHRRKVSLGNIGFALRPLCFIGRGDLACIQGPFVNFDFIYDPVKRISGRVCRKGTNRMSRGHLLVVPSNQKIQLGCKINLPFGWQCPYDFAIQINRYPAPRIIHPRDVIPGS